MKMSLINLRNIFHLSQEAVTKLRHIFSFNHLKKFILLFSFLTTFSANSVGLVIDSEVENTVRELIDPIFQTAGFHKKDIKVYILLDQSANAFVSGGSNIFIHTGIITLYNDPEVLRGVVAHELGHIAGGHLVRRHEKIQELTVPTMATTLLGIAAALGGAPEVGVALITGSSHAATRGFLSHSRSQESAADQAAIKFLHKSNYTVGGLTKILEHFSKEEANIAGQINPYAITHPLSSERLEILRAAYKKEGSKYHTSEEDKKKYARVVAKLRGFIEPVDSLVSANHKNLDPFARKYELAIASFRKPNLSEAMKKIDELIEQESKNGYLYQLKGQFLFDNGKMLDSVESYEKAVQYLKNDYVTIAEYALALIHASSLQQDPSLKERNLKNAIKLLNTVTESDVKNPYLYRNLAIAYGKIGDYGNSNLMLAEEAILYGKIPEAQNFISKAEKYAKNNKKLQLKVDDVLKTLRNINNK